MNKTFKLLVIAFFALFLTACNIQSVEQYEKMADPERSVEHSPTDVNEEKPAIPLEETIEASINEDNLTPKEEKTKETTTEKTEQQPKTETEIKQPAPEKKQQPDAKQEPKTTKQTPTPKPAEQPTKTNVQSEKKRSVTITIRVDTLLKNWDLLDPSLQSEKYVPKNGVILKTTTYELLSEKDTVWDVLQRATKEHKIQLEYQGANENMYNSVYIEGINHLYEFSAGSLSGWMYKVNGVYPNYGCSQYILKDGDIIQWDYTVDLGRDLGQEWTAK